MSFAALLPALKAGRFAQWRAGPAVREALTEKRCTKCGIVKPVSDYYLKYDKRAADKGRRPRAQCKECTKVDVRRGRSA